MCDLTFETKLSDTHSLFNLSLAGGEQLVLCLQYPPKFNISQKITGRSDTKFAKKMTQQPTMPTNSYSIPPKPKFNQSMHMHKTISLMNVVAFSLDHGYDKPWFITGSLCETYGFRQWPMAYSRFHQNLRPVWRQNDLVSN